MQLTSLHSQYDLRAIFRRLETDISKVSYITGFGDDWHNLLAINPIDEFTLTDLADLPQLHDFIATHKDHLVVGYFSYDLGLALLEIPSQHTLQQPLIRLRAYDQFLSQSGEDLLGYQLSQSDLEQFSLSEHDSISKPELSWGAEIPLDKYLDGFNTIQDYIRAGDIYQINYTHQLRAKTEQSGRDLFAHFMKHKPVSHAAFLGFAEQEVLSLSPEGFIHVDGQDISTQPIKGTRPRSADDAEDRQLREQLITSQKEQAELFMIVDLLRNDLGRVCETASVRVTDPKIVTAMPNVWHTHANITGHLKPEISTMDALLSMFPGGSITGCPKRRAMEIIDELEATSRGLYTGSIGYILPSGEASFNIAIRTMIKRAESIKLGIGGGITIKSDGHEEYAETAAKAAFFR